jgi:hypothetical protein
MGICIPKSLKERIDYSRGDIPRSKYTSKILQHMYNKEDEVDDKLENQWGNSRRQPVQPTTDSLQIHHGTGETSG